MYFHYLNWNCGNGGQILEIFDGTTLLNKCYHFFNTLRFRRSSRTGLRTALKIDLQIGLLFPRPPFPRLHWYIHDSNIVDGPITVCPLCEWFPFCSEHSPSPFRGWCWACRIQKRSPASSWIPGLDLLLKPNNCAQQPMRTTYFAPPSTEFVVRIASKWIHTNECNLT